MSVYTDCPVPFLGDNLIILISFTMKFTFESQSEIYYMLKALNETHTAIENGHVGLINDQTRKEFDSLRDKFQDFVLSNL